MGCVPVTQTPCGHGKERPLWTRNGVPPGLQLLDTLTLDSEPQRLFPQHPSAPFPSRALADSDTWVTPHPAPPCGDQNLLPPSWVTP